MRIWTCIDHDTVYPVGGASIVTAETEEQVRKLLQDVLNSQGLIGTDWSLQEVDLTVAQAIILRDGDY